MKVETPQQLHTSQHCGAGHRGVFVRVLVIEDEAKVANFIQKGLQQEQYAVDVAHDGEEGAYQADNFDYYVVILVLILPKLSGLSLLRSLRAKKPSLPVLILTAKGSVGDRVKGLDSGADDYLAKPFAFVELVARIRALLRRGQQEDTKLRVADLEMDTATHQTTRGVRRIDLKPKEFALLEFLLRNAHRPVTRTMIIEHVWDIHFDAISNVVDVHINSLRNKIDRGDLRR
jgi:DNA-binding response OmpR family regulator